MLFNLWNLCELCESIKCDYCIFVEAESVLYDDYADFKCSHGYLVPNWFELNLLVSLCINGSSIQINVEVINNGK